MRMPVLYLLNVVLVLISYEVQVTGDPKDPFYGFEYFLIFNLAYFLCWKFIFPQKIAKIHVIFLGLLYINSPPLFENDHHRYLWEGKVIAQGHNPYKLPPSSEKLDEINFKNRNLIAYNNLTSIYPPLAQVLFTILSPLPANIALLLLQFICLLLIYYLISTLGLHNSKMGLLLLPYLFKEFVQSVHIDIFAVCAILFFYKGKHFHMGILTSFLVKILSILILPYTLIQATMVRSKLIIPTTLIFATLILSVAYLLQSGETTTYTGIEAFSIFWKWNSFSASILATIFSSNLTVRIILACLFAAIYFLLIFNFTRAKCQNINHYAHATYIALFLFTPVFHPWYGIWGLIFESNNKWFNYFLFSSFLAYSSYGMSYLNIYGEIVQWILLILAFQWILVHILSGIRKPKATKVF